jgi:hypothetical protein
MLIKIYRYMLLFPFLISIAWRLLLTEGLVSFAIAFTW